MANLFPAVINYKQDFIPNDMKTVQLERTVDGRKMKSQIPKFNGDGVEMLLLCKQHLDDAMGTQDIDKGEWHDEFGQTLHVNPSDIWSEVLDAGDDGQQAFDADEAGFNLACSYYVRRYVADPNGRDTMVQALNTRAFPFGL